MKPREGQKEYTEREGDELRRELLREILLAEELTEKLQSNPEDDLLRRKLVRVLLRIEDVTQKSKVAALGSQRPGA